MAAYKVVKKRKNGEREFFTKDFWDSVATKLVAIFISVKVWGLLVTWSLSSYFLMKGLIESGDWVTINGTISGIIYGTREMFKIATIREYSEHSDEEDDE